MARGEHVVMEMEDKGLGGDERELPLLFEQFHGSRARDVRGRGGEPEWGRPSCMKSYKGTEVGSRFGAGSE